MNENINEIVKKELDRIGSVTLENRSLNPAEVKIYKDGFRAGFMLAFLRKKEMP